SWASACVRSIASSTASRWRKSRSGSARALSFFAPEARSYLEAVAEAFLAKGAGERREPVHSRRETVVRRAVGEQSPGDAVGAERGGHRLEPRKGGGKIRLQSDQGRARRG